MAERLLIVRLGSMGDVLHALPAVSAIRCAHPDAQIGWAIERRWTPLLAAEAAPPAAARTAQRPLVDRVHVMNTLGWRKAMFSAETWAEVRASFRDLRAERYDVAVDFQGSIKSAVVARFSGAERLIGFAQPREKPASMFYTSAIPTSGAHVIDQNLKLISSFFEHRPSTTGDVLPFDPAAESQIAAKLEGTSDFAILNPGAGWPAKQWPTSRYGEVARLLRDMGLGSLVNYGPGEEFLAREVEQASDGAARPIFCTLAELIALTRRAALFIGGDTGPMHLANALGVPVVTLFGPTDPARNGPYFPNSVTLRHPASRTTTAHSSKPDAGLVQITAEQVIAAARELLARSSKREDGSTRS